MKFSKAIAAILVFLALIFSNVGCSNNMTELPGLEEQSNFEAVKATHYFRDYRGKVYTNLYPKVNLADIDTLPVFFQNEPEYSLLETSLDSFAESLALLNNSFEKRYEEYDNIHSNQLVYTLEDNSMVLCSNIWGCELLYPHITEKNQKIIEDLGIYFPQTPEYEVNENRELTPAPNDIDSILEACKPLAAAIGGEDYIYGDYNVTASLVCENENGELYSPSFTIVVSYRNYLPQNASELLIDYYNLGNRIDFSFVYTDLSNPTISVRFYTCEYLTFCGDIDIIPYDTAKARFNNNQEVNYDFILNSNVEMVYLSGAEAVADYETYLVYVNNENFIRPIYMKQDHLLAGNFKGAAWIDAIDC